MSYLESLTGTQVCIILLTVGYLVYTFSYALQFHKTAGEVLDPNQKRIHSILIWLIPFVWIILLKAILKPSPKRDYGKKIKGSPYNDTYTNGGDIPDGEIGMAD